MKQSRALVTALVCLLFPACGGGSSPTAPSGSGSQTPAPSSPWISEGTRLTSAQAGITGTMADTTTLRLNDGRWRMFLFAGSGYRSAISTDGLAFTMEPGQRLPDGKGQSRILRLSDGRVRMYHIDAGGISSSISSDEGMTFTFEAMRITAAQAGLTQLSGPGLARLPDGRWRMYFSELDTPGAAIVPLPMKSATSTNLTTWTMDPGVRIGPGATLSGSAAHPTALRNADGSITVFYFRNSDMRLYSATSADGLSFTSEAAILDRAADPDIVALPDGGLRMYYNWFDAGTGAYTISSARGM